MRRISLGEGLWLVAIVAYVIGALAMAGGCSAAPDALRAAIVTSDATAVALGTARAALRARIAEDVTECASTCPDDDGRGACIEACGRAVLEQTSAIASRLDAAIALHGAAVDALAVARACRESEVTCEGEAERVARAVSQLAQAAALLREEGER